MFLKELKEVFLNPRYLGTRYLLEWRTIYRMEHLEKHQEFEEMLKKSSIEEDSFMEMMGIFRPTESSGEKEKVVYSYVYIYWLSRAADNQGKIQRNNWERLIKVGDKKLEQVLKMITIIIFSSDDYVTDEYLALSAESDSPEIDWIGLHEFLFLNAIVGLVSSLNEGGIERWYLDTYIKNKEGVWYTVTGLCDRMFAFFLAIFFNDRTETQKAKFLEKFSSCVCAILAEKLFRLKRYEEAVFYAKKGLKIGLPYARENAFNVLGLCCIEVGRKKWQLAYDAYYSWLCCEMTGELGDVKVDFRGELEWRKSAEGKKAEAEIRDNYAYLCSTIADACERDSEQWKSFQKRALKSIEISVEKLNPEDPGARSSYGAMLADNRVFEQAFGVCRNIIHLFNDGTDKAIAIRNFYNILRELVFSRYLEYQDNADINTTSIELFEQFLAQTSITNYFKDYFKKLKEYKLLVENMALDNSKDFRMEQQVMDSLEYILKTHEFFRNIKLKYKKKENNIFFSSLEYLLLLVDTAVDNMSDYLIKRMYTEIRIDTRDMQDQINRNDKQQEPIVYYTTLDTVKYLFTELYQEDSDTAPSDKKTDEEDCCGKNCLTMMHAMYMNDPNEGLTLLQALEKSIAREDGEYQDYLFRGMSAVEFREKLYDKKYIFLKAFTSRVDQLDMWAMYASDRQSGSDSNGCCVCLNPETFSRAIDMQNEIEEKSNNISKRRGRDNFHLYRVVYVAQDGSIDPGKNRGLSPKVYDYYNAVRNSIRILNQYLNKAFTEMCTTEEAEDLLYQVREFLQHSFGIVAFLFKEDSYFLEEERRLILTRSHDQKQLIRHLNTNPPKLCVNPFFQVYVDQVILGPKVKNVDNWIPYFQYELNEMREKDDFPAQTVVRKSKIHYRD